MSKNNFVTGILIIIILLLGNIYLATQYISASKELKTLKTEKSLSANTNTQSVQVLKEFLDVVLNTRGTNTSDNRIKLENDLRQLKDPAITKAWENLVASKDAKATQAGAIKVLGLLEDKIAD